MLDILLTILAIIPGLVICYIIFRFDKHEQEPKWPLVISFGLGVLSAFPALKLEEYGDSLGINESGGFGMLLLLSFVVIALSEELMKYIALVAFPFQKRFFNEPIDGIIYAVLIGMGFATVENIIYALRFGTETTIVRAFTAVPAHGVFAIWMGYFTGIAKFKKGNKKFTNLGLGLLMAVLVHGTYDLFILQQYFDWLILFATVVLIVSGYFAYRLLKEHQNNSPFIKNTLEKESTVITDHQLENHPAQSNQSIDSDNDMMNDILDELDDKI